ncbi:lipase maturation factor family protein [Prescottella defluvii]|nr:lipase maturation factor family protein [Prescottella defluvii]
MGLLAVFVGNAHTAPPLLTLLLLRWLLFRLEFGAGLIKIRGDPCWRDLTCLYYHHETQPMPGPLSWHFHHLPRPLHKVEVAGDHFTQLIVPFFLFVPQPVAGGAAAIMILTQLWLVVSGDFAVARLRSRSLLGLSGAAERVHGRRYDAASGGAVGHRPEPRCGSVVIGVRRRDRRRTSVELPFAARNLSSSHRI